jgi:hypothetical protein
MKSFRAKDGSAEPPTTGRNGERSFKKAKRSNAPHAKNLPKSARLGGDKTSAARLSSPARSRAASSRTSPSTERRASWARLAKPPRCRSLSPASATHSRRPRLLSGGRADKASRRLAALRASHYNSYSIF